MEGDVERVDDPYERQEIIYEIIERNRGITSTELKSNYIQRTGCQKDTFYEDLKPIRINNFIHLSEKEKLKYYGKKMIYSMPGKGRTEKFHIVPSETEEEVSENGEMEDEGTGDGGRENEEERTREKEFQRIREDMELRGKYEDEREEKRERERQEKEEERRQEMREKEDIKELLARWFHQLPRVYRGQEVYLYIEEIHLYHDYVPSDRMECIVDYTDDEEKFHYLYPDEFVSYFGQPLKIEENWRYKKYSKTHLPEITELYENMKNSAQDHFRKEMKFSIEEGIRSRKEDYRKVYLKLSKGACTDSGVIKKVKIIREMIKEVQREKYF